MLQLINLGCSALSEVILSFWVAQSQDGFAQTLPELSVEKANTINHLLLQRTILIVLLLIVLMVVVILAMRIRAIRLQEAPPAEEAEPSSLLLLTEYFRGMEEEQCRISRELHDGPCSALAGALNMLDKQGYEDPHIQEVRSWMKETMKDLRNLSHNLSPPNLYESNLERVTSDLVARLTHQTAKKITFAASSQVSWHRVSLDCQLHVYRIAQELLHNIVTHSDATRVEAILSVTNKDINFILEDNSTNYKHEQGKGIGSANIANRLELVGGNLSVKKTDHGVSFSLSTPTQLMPTVG